jgi:hypothetical protein
MKYILFVFVLFIGTATSTPDEDEVELVCTRKHNASNTCHYNFRINGVNYRFADIGCKNKRDELVKKAQAGKLGLAKDWKVECITEKKRSSN